MKKKIILMIIMFAFLTSKPNTVFADMNMFDPNMNMFDTSMDFSMDMIMEQGMMSMNDVNDVINNAEEINFMNHDLDNTLTFFFDNLDDYHNLDNFNDFSIDNNLIHDAFIDGNWSDSFNDHFNIDSGLLFPEIEFIEEVQVDTPQGLLDNADITNNSYMPEHKYSESDFPNETEIPNHSDVMEQIDNNTMPEETPENIGYSDTFEPKNDEEPSSNKKEDDFEPKTSNDISTLVE